MEFIITILQTAFSDQVQFTINGDDMTPGQLQEELKENCNVNISDEQLFNLMITDSCTGTYDDGLTSGSVVIEMLEIE